MLKLSSVPTEGVAVIETQGLTHINLLVADVQRAKAFYETVFGFETLFWDGPTLCFMRPPGTGDTFTLQQSDQAARGAGHIDHFGFRLKDPAQLDRAIEEVVAAGGRFVERCEHAPGRPYAYVADPDDHLIEL